MGCVMSVIRQVVVAMEERQAQGDGAGRSLVTSRDRNTKCDSIGMNVSCMIHNDLNYTFISEEIYLTTCN